MTATMLLQSDHYFLLGVHLRNQTNPSLLTFKALMKSPTHVDRKNNQIRTVGGRVYMQLTPKGPFSLIESNSYPFCAACVCIIIIGGGGGDVIPLLQPVDCYGYHHVSNEMSKLRSTRLDHITFVPKTIAHCYIE